MSRDLIGLLPGYYGGSPPMTELQRVLSLFMAQAEEDRDYILDQIWPQTASGDGLAIWETAYGIPVDISKDLDYRRSRLLSKVRGQGTPTVALLQRVASSYVNGEIEIIEHNDEHYFVVKYTAEMGIPPNIDDLTAALLEIKPAHMEMVFEFLFRLWGELVARTWSSLAGFTWDQIRGGDIQ